MEDIIDIIVTETTNLITITSSGSDEVIDVNIIDNREDIVLNVTPTVVEININSLVGNFGVNWGQIGGTLTNQTDLNTALGLKADLVGGKVPSSQLPSYVDDVVEVANYAALPATGETGKIYVTIDTNYIYRWTGSVYVEIKDSSAVWGAITGTLSNQTDLQNALNAKFDDPIGDATQYIDGTGALQTFPVLASADKLILVVRNTSGATITKGTVVYINGANGNKPTIAKALATSDATSAQTLGLLQADIANNSNGNVVLVGSVIDLDTSAFTEGQQLYLSGVTAGAYTATKTLAPTHLVYVGVIARAHPTQGVIEVKIQNGYELDEIHDVSIISKANNEGLFYESSTSLWKNKSIATVLGYTPANGANYLPLAGGTMTGAIVGTTATFTNSGSGIGLGVTLSGATGDGIKITHSAGRAFNIQSSGSGYGILINNETASTSAPFTIQKQGANKITFSDLGAGIFASGLTAETLDLSNTTASNALRINHTNTSYHAVSITATGGSALYATGSVTVIGTLTATGVVTAQSGLANGSGQSFTLPSTTGTLALTSQLSAYLPLAGGTLTGALSGTSASFSSTVTLSNNTYLQFNNSSGTARTILTVDASNTTVLRHAASGGVFALQNFANTQNNLLIADSGAATFASTISTPSFISSDTEFRLGAPFSRIATLDSSSGFGGGYNLNWNNASPVHNSTGALSGYGYGAGGSVSFYTNSSAAANTAVSPRMHINSSGNVGIGTTAPNQSGTSLALSINSTNPILELNISNARNGYLYTDGAEVRLSSVPAIPLTFFTTNTERMRITSGGNLLISTTTTNPGQNNTDTGTSFGSGRFFFNNGGTDNIIGRNTDGTLISWRRGGVEVGSVGVSTVLTTYNTTSDYRLKEDLQPIKGLEIVNKIKVYDYKWKSEDSRMDGVMAHELAEVLPYAVTGAKDGAEMQAVDYSKIVPVMVQAIKEEDAKIIALQNKVTELETKIKTLENK
jgi:hypothetical protein